MFCIPFTQAVANYDIAVVLIPLEMATNGGVIETQERPSTTFNESVTTDSKPNKPTPHPGESATINNLEVPTILKVLAYTIAIFFGLAVFIFAVLSKTAFMAIASKLYIGNTSTKECHPNSEPVRQRSVAFVQLMLALCVPQVVTVLRTLFFGVLKAKENFPWPSVQACALVSGRYT